MARSILFLSLSILAGCAAAPEPAPTGIRELPHLDTTPPELRAEIDRLTAVLVDFNAGADGLDAQERLVEIGRPAVPKVLSAFLHTGPWEEMEAMINACVVDGTLRRMVPEEAKIPRLIPFARPTAKTVRGVVTLWFEWWDGNRSIKSDG
ncbi:MAG: hypothetical protein ABFS86_12715 [Planctomycetota bacterium]